MARFATKYAARSQALFWVASDHYVVAPWVARDGAVDVRREGRLGAAIKSKEYERVVVVPRKDGFSVDVDSAHGSMEVLNTDDEEQANRMAQLVERRLSAMDRPTRAATKKKKATPKAAAAEAGS